MRKRLLGSLLFLLFCLLPVPAALAQEPATGDGTIHLQTGAFDPLLLPTAATAATTAATAATTAASPYYLVQFAGPVQPFWLEQVAALGGEVVGYVPNDTHIVRMAPPSVIAVAQLPAVRWVGPFLPAYKIAPELTAASTAVGAAAATDIGWIIGAMTPRTASIIRRGSHAASGSR